MSIAWPKGERIATKWWEIERMTKTLGKTSQPRSSKKRTALESRDPIPLPSLRGATEENTSNVDSVRLAPSMSLA
jgi:hypothetical protein